MIATPDLSHLTSKDYDLVYEPAEDTFLLMDALETDITHLHNQKPKICLEIGSGSGCVSVFMDKLLSMDNIDCKFYCTDINPHAVEATARTAAQNGIPASRFTVRQDEFCNSLVEELKGKCDVILYNPPYVVTPSEEYRQNEDMLAKSWAGGVDGREVIDQFIDKQIPNMMLSRTGCMYMVAIAENRPQELMQIFQQRWNMQSDIVMKRKAGREQLYIIKTRRV